MRYWLYSEIKAKVEHDLDLEDETFITDVEMLAYANSAMDEAEAEVHGIYEDYFLRYTNLALVTGQESYALPGDIYANKIRKIIYRNGTDVYPINRIRGQFQFEEYARELSSPTSTVYKYFITNQAPGAPTIILSPPAKETSSQNVTIWYLRNANRFYVDTDKCDIPEFVSFVIAYMKVKCYEKEGNPLIQVAVQELEQQRAQMTSTLQNMVPDDDDKIQGDFSIYREHS